MRNSIFSLGAAVLIGGACFVHAAEPVTISEFLASNSSGLRDEDNQLGDWIELRNSGTNAVNLDGWYLTDSASNLTKWRLPNTNINAGAFLVVFADGKNRSVPGAVLHTSFSLSTSGEYLALVKPDGVTRATEFAPVFPGQVPNVSYGFGTIATNATLLTSNALVRVRIPNGSEGDWTGTNYDDSAWILGTNGVGFGSTNTTQADYGQAVLTTAPLGYWRLNEASGTTAANLGSGAANGTYNNVTLGGDGPRPPSFNGFEANNNAATFNGSSSYVAGPAGLLSGRGAFTVGGWVNLAATPGSRIGLFGQNDCLEFGFASGTTIEIWTPGGGTFQLAYPFPLNTWHHVVGVGDGTLLRVYLDGVQAGTGGSATANYGSSSFNFNIGGGGIQDATGNFFNGKIDEVVVYPTALSAAQILALYQFGTNAVGGSAVAFVRTDVGGAMSNVNASAYIRIPFTVEDPSILSALTLRMRHDDGFVAYLNGSEVQRVNAPVTPNSSSAATNTHSPLTFDQFVFGPGTIAAGTNILAIQGLNVAANDPDFLIAAELTATYNAGVIPSPVYFTSPTPGSANLGGIANPGPQILDASHTPKVPLDAEDVVVTARFLPTFLPISSVVMRYRIMYNAEVEVPMFDDGLHGDGATNDGVYGASIPQSASTNGQMIRWYFQALDSQSHTSRYPVFATTTDTAQYLGTVVAATNVTSKLPIFHLFAPAGVVQTAPPTAQTGADSEAGAQVSLFYDGEFYDNIHMSLRGNTSAGQAKKSHRLEFNRDHLFRHSPDYPRVRKTSFMAEFLDPAYIRQHLSFWLLEQMGVPAPFFYPVRAQLNGSFYALVFHSDVIDEEQMDRMGYDPAGALYKAVGVAAPSQFSTGVFQKKTEPLADTSDYQTLVRAINETNTLAGRRAALFDMLDVPEVINHLAGTRWCSENDDVWANMSFYRDTFGDQLWRLIPFDMNASWGQLYGGNTPLSATNDASKSHPLYGNSLGSAGDGPAAPNNYNRMYDAIVQVPETRQMLLRRQRTVLDRWVLEPGVAPESRLLETHIRYMTNQIWDEAFLDRARWGFSTWTASNKYLTNAVNELFNEFINPRRIHWSATHNITNVAKPLGVTPTSNAGIPQTQPANVALQIVALDYNPASASQAQEFIALSNSSPIAVDISNWQLDGAVSFTFKQGTVVPSNSVVYVSPDMVGFRTRTTGPRAGQGLFVVGPYKGQLDARGETIALLNASGLTNNALTYLGTPGLAQQYLRITEVMYHPGPTNAGSPYAQEEFEYLELKNIGPTNLNLVGIHFTNGVVFAFTAGSAVTNLAPGQVVLLVKNSAAYNYRHGGGVTIAGTFTGGLDNNGERVTLHDAVGEQIMDFTYNNSWYPITDGLGFSLVVVNENAPWTSWDLKSNWRASGNVNGSPGVNEPVPPVFVPVLVNEVRANSFPDPDAIELWNNTTNTADISGWWISDDFFAPFKYRVPASTILAPGGFVVFTEAQFNPGGTGFAFGAKGDDAYVFSADGPGNLAGYYHGFAFADSETGVTFGRYVTSDGDEHFVAQAAVTLHATNSAPRVGPVAISEIMYHPPDLAGAVDDSLNEYIELQNISANPVALYDLAYPTNRWELRSAVNFAFSTNTIIPAGGFLVVVSFDPATNVSALANFRDRYGLDTNVVIVGPYSGQLDNSEDNLELHKPETSNPTNFAFVLVERVHYHDVAPWDAVADGAGASLHRIVVGDFGNDATNWIAAGAGPGAAFIGGTSPVVTQQPTDATVFAGGTSGSSTLYVFGTTNFTAVVSGSSATYQWRFNGGVIPGATNAILVLTNIQPGQAGTYSFLAFNSGGSVLSSNATLTVVIPISFTSQPNAQNVQPGTNVTINAVATGNGPVRYQWRFEGTNIPNATNASHSFTGANITNHHGNFSVVATDDLGSVLSSNAFIYVLLKPGVTVPIMTNTVLQGANVTLSVTATGAPPMYYRWLRQGSAFATSSVPFITVTNVQSSGRYQVVVTNQASSSSASPGAGITNVFVLLDLDHDGVADVWELAYGFSTNNAADALADFDGDGMNNRDEYLSGTNPTNALSVLKIVLSATNATVLNFTAQSNISYTVQWRTNLVTPAWSNLTSITAQPLVRTVLVNTATAPAGSERYLRIITPLVP